MIYHFKSTPIHFEIFGKGPAIVLLHGFLESSIMWNPLISTLSEKHFVITIDFPGHGKSGVISEIHSMELMAEVVNEILEHLKIPSAIFIGHSMGGYVTMAFAELFPKKMDKLILLNSTPAADSEEKKENRNRSLKLINKNPTAFISMAITNLFAESSQQKFYSQIQTLKEEANTFPVEGIKAAVKGMRDRKDRTEILENLNKIKFSILSENDPLLLIEENKKLAERCKAKTITIEGGHHSTYENLNGVLENLSLILKV